MGSATDATVGRIQELDVAVAHWHINAWGGAEYLVTKLAEAVGTETVLTTGEPEPDRPNPYGDVKFYDVIQDQSYALVKHLQLQCDRIFEYALWEDVDWREYNSPDIVITSGATPRAIITPDKTLHVNYCHSPPRWFYDLYHDRKDSLTGTLARPLIRYLRMRDTTVDPRVNHYFANSPIIARRLYSYYHRDGEVLYPPIDIEEYQTQEPEGFYLHLGRLDNEKGVPAVAEAFADGERRLILAGGRGDIGSSVRTQIEQCTNIEYRGFVDEEEKKRLLATCTAVIFNGQDEDFGIVPIEANASGKPVLARKEGFPELFITEGENGYLHDGSAADICKAIGRFENQGLADDPRSAVEPFSISTFREQLASSLRDQYETVRTEMVT